MAQPPGEPITPRGGERRRAVRGNWDIARDVLEQYHRVKMLGPGATRARPSVRDNLMGQVYGPTISGHQGRYLGKDYLSPAR